MVRNECFAIVLKARNFPLIDFQMLLLRLP